MSEAETYGSDLDRSDDPPDLDRYAVEIDLENPGSNHAQMVRLVGFGKRVLDVGCWTGDLGRVLLERACNVVGIEVDPHAAEIAQKHLDHVIVGDVEELDLDDALGSRRFDVILLGDILEHLRDPLGALRGLGQFLDTNGYIVASIPNVAHAAVRLSLLEGRFEYSDTGLLDKSHYHFFTRETMEGLFGDAGMVVVDMVRIQAGPFDTEIPVERDGEAAELAPRLVEDPDATTYQFVIKAVRDDDSHAIAQIVAREKAAVTAVSEARRHFNRISDELLSLCFSLGLELPDPVASDSTAQPRVAVVGEIDRDDWAEVLRAQVVSRELHRRLPCASIRFLGLYGARPSAKLDTGIPVEALGAWSDQRLAELADEFDAIVSLAEITAADPRVAARYGVEVFDLIDRSPSSFFTGGLGPDLEERCPFVTVSASVQPDVTRDEADAIRTALSHRGLIAVRSEQDAVRLRNLGLSGTVIVVPDPLLLCPRVFPPEATAEHLGYLRLVDWYPSDGASVVVVGSDALTPQVPELVEVLRAVNEPDTSIVALELPGAVPTATAADRVVEELSGPCYRAPPEVTLQEVVTVLSRARLVISDLPEPLAVAVAYRRPAIALQSDGVPAEYVAHVAHSVGQFRELYVKAQAEPLPVDRFVATTQRLDQHFDCLAGLVYRSVEKRNDRIHEVDLDEALRLVDRLRRHIDALRVAHQRRGEQMARERRVLRDELVRARERADVQLERQPRALDELAALSAELSAIYATKTWRMLSKPRAVYGRIRRIVG